MIRFESIPLLEWLELYWQQDTPTMKYIVTWSEGRYVVFKGRL